MHELRDQSFRQYLCATCVGGFSALFCGHNTIHCQQMDPCDIKRKSIVCQFSDSVSCWALPTHYLQCAHSLHGWTNLWGSGGSSSVLMTTLHWPLQRKQMEPQGDVSISLTTWVSQGKGTDVGLRMRTGWGAGQGHHTSRLGSDKHGWLGVFTCPRAIKGRRGERLELWIECNSTEGQRGC